MSDFEALEKYKITIEDIMKALPVNVFIKDINGVYLYCSQIWMNINVPENEKDWDIKGKTDEDIRKDKENVAAAREADKRIIETGEPQNYTIKVVNDDKTITYMELTKNPIYNQDNKIIGIVGLIQDVTKKVLDEEKEKEKQRLDLMTGVYNRNYYDQYILNEAKNISGPYSLVEVDLNGLKYVNDTYGHDMGDEYIEKTANILKTFLPKKSKIFRIGGDEFIAIVKHSANTRILENITTIKLACSTIFFKDFQMSLAIGASTTHDNNQDIKDLIKEADELMYKDKEAYYSSDMSIAKRTI